MSQQLNLLPKAKSRYSPATVSLAIVGLVFIALLATWGVKRTLLAGARASEAASAAQLVEVTAQFEQRYRSRVVQINAEIETLKPRAAEAEQLIRLAAGVGSPQGYLPHFMALAKVREDRLWLSEMTVGQGGKALQLSGQALEKEAVLRYMERLNAAFAESGIKLTMLELTSQTIQGGPANSAPLNVIKFSLR